MLPRIALVVVFLFAASLTQLSFADEAKNSDRQSASRRGNGRLVLDMPPLKFASRERLQQQSARLLVVASSVPEYHCTVPEAYLNAMLPSRVKFDAQFRDVLVDIPVHGGSHAQGTLQVKLVQDREHASFDLCFMGTIQMVAEGHSRGIQIDSDATTDFMAVKRITLDKAGLFCLPAECEAQSTLTIKRITNRRPRLMGNLVERIARRRANSTTLKAEKECCAHIEEVVRDYMDRHVESLAQVVNVALRSHVQALSAEDKLEWSKIRFCTNRDCLLVVRGTPTHPAWEQHATEAGALVIAMPRTRLGQNAGIGLLLIGELDGEIDADRKGTALHTGRRMAFRPTIKWEAEALTVRLEVDARDLLVRDEDGVNGNR
jgi:hypothetical protein